MILVLRDTLKKKWISI